MILGPFLGSRWRQAGALLLATFVALRIVLSVELPAEVFLALAIGRRGRCRHAARVRSSRPAPVGRHRGRQPRQLPGSPPPTSAALTPGRGGSRVFLATLDDGAQLLVKVRSPDERSADLLFRLYR